MTRHDDTRQHPSEASATLAKRTAITGMIILAMVIALLAVWYLLDVVLLAFAGMLLAILVRTLSVGVARITRLSVGWAYLIVVIALVGLFIIIVYFVGSHIVDQWYTLTEQIPESLRQLESRVRDYSWGERILNTVSDRSADWSQALNFFSLSKRVFMRTAGVLTSIVVLLFVALYLAYDPQNHKRVLVLLLPPSLRVQARRSIDNVTYVLKWWLLGKILSMTIVGVLTFLGLWLLGVPLASTLALIAFLLAFIPNFGPILSFIPAVLVAFSENVALAGYVALLYLGIQTVESYLITPLIQQRNVSLPPALIILGQVVMGVLAGALGVALATPLFASINTCIRTLYTQKLDDDETPPSTPTSVRHPEAHQPNSGQRLTR